MLFTDDRGVHALRFGRQRFLLSTERETRKVKTWKPAEIKYSMLCMAWCLFNRKINVAQPTVNTAFWLQFPQNKRLHWISLGAFISFNKTMKWWGSSRHKSSLFWYFRPHLIWWPILGLPRKIGASNKNKTWCQNPQPIFYVGLDIKCLYSWASKPTCLQGKFRENKIPRVGQICFEDSNMWWKSRSVDFRFPRKIFKCPYILEDIYSLLFRISHIEENRRCPQMISSWWQN